MRDAQEKGAIEIHGLFMTAAAAGTQRGGGCCSRAIHVEARYAFAVASGLVQRKRARLWRTLLIPSGPACVKHAVSLRLHQLSQAKLSPCAPRKTSHRCASAHNYVEHGRAHTCALYPDRATNPPPPA